MDLWHLSETIIWRSPGMSGQLYTVDKCEIYDVYYYVFCSVDNKNSLGHIRTCLYCDENYTQD